MKTLIELYDDRPIENVLGTEMFRPERPEVWNVWLLCMQMPAVNIFLYFRELQIT